MKNIFISLLLIFVSCDIYASGFAHCTGELEVKNKVMLVPEKRFQTHNNHYVLVGVVIKVNECINHGCDQVGVGNWAGLSSFRVENKKLLKHLSDDQKGVFDPEKIKLEKNMNMIFIVRIAFPPSILLHGNSLKK